MRQDTRPKSIKERYNDSACMLQQCEKMHPATSCKVVGRVFFSGNQLFWMEELTVGARAHLINNCRFLSSLQDCIFAG